MHLLRIAAVLPHLEVFGGIRRYLMLARVWGSWGHEVTLWTPGGEPPRWLDTPARVRHLGEDPGPEPWDVVFTPQPALLDAARALPATRRVYYCVLEDERGESRALAASDFALMANSGPLRARLARRSRRPVLDGIGGIDPDFFHPYAEARDTGRLTVMAYGRRSRPKKGTDLIVRAVERVAPRFPSLELALFDHIGPGNERDPREGFAPRVPFRFTINPGQDELARRAARADVFVAAERKAGWCNTAIEAMSAGVAVVCTPSGTRDFARHGETAWVVPIRHSFFLARGLARVLSDPALRARLQAAGPGAVRPYAWPILAGKILDQLGLGEGVPAGARTPRAAAM
ncbi:MAG: glycosyltransferase family 4 protein [Candidatus Eisenbacteria bacterium]